MSMFRVKLSYGEFLNRARNYPVPFKFYMKDTEKITMFMQYIMGSSSIELIFWSEVVGDDGTLKKVEADLKREGFKYALSFELPRP